jgi:tRNA/tmRNA/rRNA uracil-C5-methylase (TrmA/RlmC/RlmD family)
MAGDAITENSGQHGQVISMEQSYVCKVCTKALPSGAYSKSQINKLQHNKIEAVKCISCTDAMSNECERKVIPDEPEVVVREAVPRSEVNTKKSEPSSRAKPKTYDPSLQYIKNPKAAPIVKDAMAFAASHGLPYPVRLGPINGWRTVVKMAVRGVVKRDAKGREFVESAIGLFRPGSHDVASCLDSTAHHPAINRALARIEEARKQVGLNGYIEGTGHTAAEEGQQGTASFKHNCYLKYVILVLARQTNTVQLSLVWNTEPTGDENGERILNMFVAKLLGDTGHGETGSTHKQSKHSSDSHSGGVPSLFHSIWVNYNPSSRYNNAITGRGEESWKLLHGAQYTEEIVRTDMKSPPVLRFPPFVFRQANICAFTQIICNVRHWVKDMAQRRMQVIPVLEASEKSAKRSKKGKSGLGCTESGAISTDNAENVPDRSSLRCVELYAGVGTIGLNCLDLLSELNCSDENPHNLACFEAARAAIEPAALRERAAYRPQAAATVAVSGGLRDYDLVIVDPPRKGLDDEVIAAMLEYREVGVKDCVSLEDMVGGKRRHSEQVSGTEPVPAPGVGGGFVRNNERLIYVSCGFPAFKRDAARLLGLAPVSSAVAGKGANNGSSGGHNRLASVKDSGAGVAANTAGNIRYWKLVHLEGHILFPGSDHIETLAVFDRL